MSAPSLRTLAAASLGVVCLGLAATGCGSSDAANASSGTSVCPDGKLSFGVEPFEDPAKLTAAYKLVGTELGKALGCDVTVTVVQDYSAEVLAMKNGKLDLGQFGPLGYVFASTQADAKPVASFGTADGKLSTYTAALWVKKGSPITSVADLKGKTLALSEPGSTSGDALPREALRKAGLDEKKDLKVEYAGGHPESLLALTNGKVDAAEINSQQQATSQAAGQFDPTEYTKIWTSDPIPNDPITIAGSASPKLQAAVKKALLELSPETVAAAGKLLDVDPPGKLVAVTKSDYEPLFTLATSLGLTSKDL